MRKQPNSRSCFICGVDNVAGVQVRFYDTTDSDGRPEVLARFTGTSRHQGYPQRMHGGVITGILDETIGRAINAAAAEGDSTVWGVAAELAVRFPRPVPLGVELTARGRILSVRRRLFEGTGELYLPDGTVAVTAQGMFVKMNLEEIAREIDPESLGWRVYEDGEERGSGDAQ